MFWVPFSGCNWACSCTHSLHQTAGAAPLLQQVRAAVSGELQAGRGVASAGGATVVVRVPQTPLHYCGNAVDAARAAPVHLHTHTYRWNIKVLCWSETLSTSLMQRLNWFSAAMTRSGRQFRESGRHLDERRVAGRAVPADGRGRGRGPVAEWAGGRQVVNSAGVQSCDRHHLTVTGQQVRPISVNERDLQQRKPTDGAFETRKTVAPLLLLAPL